MSDSEDGDGKATPLRRDSQRLARGRAAGKEPALASFQSDLNWTVQPYHQTTTLRTQSELPENKEPENNDHESTIISCFHSSSNTRLLISQGNSSGKGLIAPQQSTAQGRETRAHPQKEGANREEKEDFRRVG